MSSPVMRSNDSSSHISLIYCNLIIFLSRFVFSCPYSWHCFNKIPHVFDPEGTLEVIIGNSMQISQIYKPPILHPFTQTVNGTFSNTHRRPSVKARALTNLFPGLLCLPKKSCAVLVKLVVQNLGAFMYTFDFEAYLKA